MIKSRPSNDILHTEVILEKITEYDIFRHYCFSFKILNKKFCSELRKDNKPSVSIVNYKGGLLYKDFGHPEHTFNCFGYVQYKYNVTFPEALTIIDNDFNLGLSCKDAARTFTRGYIAHKYNYKLEAKKLTIIKIKSRDWNFQDAKFWKQYGISKKILRTFAVKPIAYYWINENRFKSKTPTYAFRFKNKYKIYAPYEKETKWFSNTSKEDIQGYDQLCESGDILYITSSLKDVMCLHVLGLPAVAFQSEMQMPDELQMQGLRDRFKRIIIFYDNDFESLENPGQTMAMKIADKFKLTNLCIPRSWRCKDISDAIVVHGLNKTKLWLENIDENVKVKYIQNQQQ
tara:strand:+ start:461 stop:1492 length:1032 start_codon:yes stop_codon:yes gene_type:complete